MRIANGAAASVVVTCFAVNGLADPSMADKALATRLYDEAEKLMVSRSYAAACPKYAESQQRDPQLGTLLHLADCYEKSGKFTSAWVTFNEAADMAGRRTAAGLRELRTQTARDRAV